MANLLIKKTSLDNLANAVQRLTRNYKKYTLEEMIEVLNNFKSPYEVFIPVRGTPVERTVAAGFSVLAGDFVELVPSEDGFSLHIKRSVDQNRICGVALSDGNSGDTIMVSEPLLE